MEVRNETKMFWSEQGTPSGLCLGGVAVLAGKVQFEGNNFTSNDADNRGGGLFFDNANFLVVINDSLITRNTAKKGGAMAVSCHTSVVFFGFLLPAIILFCT